MNKILKRTCLGSCICVFLLVLCACQYSDPPKIEEKPSPNVIDEAINENSELLISGYLPVFSFEEEVPFWVKISNSGKSVSDATVIFQITPGATPPPFGHDHEMACCFDYLDGKITSDVEEYLLYLKNMDLASEKSVHKVAVYNQQAERYEVNCYLSRFPYAIEIFVVDSEGKLHVPDHVYPHRSHCEYFDVTNIELVQGYLYQMEKYIWENDWENAERKWVDIEESLKGKHGMFFMLGVHHGESIDSLVSSVNAVKDAIDRKDSSSMERLIADLRAEIETGKNYFATIEVSTNTESNVNKIIVRDNVNDKYVTNALVIVQEEYDPYSEADCPSIVPINHPSENIYHAKVSRIPDGKIALEREPGVYEIDGVDFDNSSVRIFVYYVIDLPGIPSKFITKEINMS